MFSFLLVPVVAVNIAVAPCPSQGSSCYVETTNTVYIAPSQWNSPLRNWVRAHEFGHAYDSQVGRPTGWGIEQFANGYADCALRRPERPRRLCGWLWKQAPYRLLLKRSR